MLANKQFARGTGRGSFFTLQKQKLWKQYLQDCRVAAAFPCLGWGRRRKRRSKRPDRDFRQIAAITSRHIYVLPNAQVIDFPFPHNRSEHSGGLMGLVNTWESHVCRDIPLVTWKLLQ